MGDAAEAVTETPAAEAQPAAETEFMDPVDAAIARAGADEGEAQTEETPAEPAATKGEPEPKAEEPKGQAAALPDADEALFSDKALSSAAGVKAAAARLRVLRGDATTRLAEAEKKQRAADRLEIAVKSRERKFEKTRADHLAWHDRERNTARMLGGHLDVLSSSHDPKAVLDSLGFLMQRDGRSAYEMIVAGGAKMRKEPDPETAALRRELAEMRQGIQREREEANQAAEQRKMAGEVQRREGEILTAAKDAAKYPTLAPLVEGSEELLLEEVVKLKREHKKLTGLPLSDHEAMVALDRKVALLRGQSGGTGNPRAPGEGGSTNPGGQPSQSNPAKQPSQVAGIPPSAATRVPAQREPTDEERRQDITPEYLQSIGAW